MSLPETPSNAHDVFEKLETYNWDDDVEFQSGLSAILGNNCPPEQAAELTLRARCFYYSRKHNVNIDFDAYRAYHNARSSNGAPSGSTSTEESAGGILPTPANANEPPVPYPSSFAHIVELITTGQPIPGIREIPNTVLTGQGSAPAKPKRRKPWEKDETSPAPGQEPAAT
ncbi:uncharacterized protein EI97DRAFT_439408 [Westerdykella ornata]|uniref:Uncharacterized protein n=1 Tax=Westerdykella ornata TaxID=318751 RepID=A0A6A6JUS8_WESOR|nr:uncharacterized protein EI97DRAFT_439408 [Westerdykella ornata]KAF2280381.1 hypothetical protein EI97DRAFT_439408 [Westerdykella ornata]